MTIPPWLEPILYIFMVRALKYLNEKAQGLNFEPVHNDTVCVSTRVLDAEYNLSSPIAL
jgi:hypothetical protein